MTSIIVVVEGKEVETLTCPESASAKDVKAELIAAYGPGLIKRGEELILTSTGTLKGVYQFHVTGMCNLFLIPNTIQCNKLIATYRTNC